jgi:hypothetical protein
MSEGGLNKIDKKEAKPSIKDVEKVLEQIDFKEFAAIYREIGERSGIAPEDMSAITRDTISVRTPESLFPLLDHVIGGWATFDGYLTLQADAIARRAAGHGIRKKIPLAVVTFKMLCHEEAHGSAYRGGSMMHRQMGVGVYRHFAPKGERDEFRMLNEAITDVIGERVFKEYLNRRRIVDVRIPDREVRGSDWYDSYVLPRAVLSALTKRIARQFEVPDDVVENAFIRAAFEGEDLSSNEVCELFEESVSPEFFARLQGAAAFPVADGLGPTVDLAKIVYELKSKEWTDALSQKWAQLLRLSKTTK